MGPADGIAQRRLGLTHRLRWPSAGGASRLAIGLALWIGSSYAPLAVAQPVTPATAFGIGVHFDRPARLAQAQTLLKLKNGAAAATLLWDIVALGPAGDELTYREALYTLGEALYQQGERRAAQRILTQLCDSTPPSPRAPLALVRLLELAIELSTDERTADWMAQLERLPAAERPPNAGYVSGRLLLLRKRYADAKTVLRSAAAVANSPYALRARYLLGATLVAQNELPAAETEFLTIVDAPLPADAADDDRRTVELSQMALGRIYHARGESDKAHRAYLQVSQKSDLFRDAIYEASWAAIRSRNFERAEQALLLLLLAYRDEPQTSYPAAEAKMLLGNLLLRRGEAEAALDWFQKAKQDAAPIVESLAEKLARPDPEQLAAQITADPRHFDLEKLAPPAALPMLRADPDIGRYFALQRALQSLGRGLDELEQNLRLLERQLGPTAGSDEAGDSATALGREREELRAYREALAQSSREAAQLGGALLSAAGQATHRKFAEVLVRAEAGFVDVAWARKTAHSDRISSLIRDEKRDLRILDDEFAPEATTKSSKPSEAAKGRDPSPEQAASSAPAKPNSLDNLTLPATVPADIAEDLRRYLESAKEYASALHELGQQGYRHRRGEVSSEYVARIRSEEGQEQRQRNQAISQFEQFLAHYPNHQRYTPDAQFRLAELYFERSSEEFALAVRKQSDGNDTSGLPNYGASVELYRRLLRDYPSYRLIDGVHYLLGYSLAEMGKEPEARQAFLALVCNNHYRPLDPPAPWPGRKLKEDPYLDCHPLKGDSRFVAETWTRLGEQHFDRGELEAAIAAYTQVLGFRESPYFDKALYKLAWSHYRADHFVEAVRRFDELVVFADQKRPPGQKLERQDKNGSSLRSEAVQYLALSFAERDWDGDGRTDAETGIARLEKYYQGRSSEPHVREVLIRLGDIWYERTEFARAAEAYQHAISREPLAPDSPKLQERVVAAFDRLRSFEQALRARESLARDYLPGSPWYDQNRRDPDALATAAELAEASLLHAITNRHASAQELRRQALAGGPGKIDGKLLAEARAGYRQAAESYGSYLKQHPEAKNAYEYSYLQAESHFYAGDYAAAALAYAKVREADKKGAHLEEAAYGAVKAQEHLALAVLRNDGKSTAGEGDDVSRALDDKLPPLPVVGKQSGPLSPIGAPTEIEDLQVAYERFVALVPQSERAALLAYKAAELDFRYQRFERARPRFALVLDRYCQSERAIDAGNAILVSHTIDGNLDQVESWTTRIQQLGCGGVGKLASQQRDSLKKLSEDVSFKKAEQLLENKRYEAAAMMFVALVDKSPRAATADKALNNAAVAYENLKRYGLAANLYERLARDYPQSPLGEEAIFRAAVNNQRLFLFDKALPAYRAVATLPRYQKSEHRHDALYNAALLADRDGDVAVASELWRLYQADPATPAAEVNEAAYRVALLSERSGSPQRVSDEWERFIRRIAGQAEADPALLARLVEAHYRLGHARERLHNPFDARESYAKAAKLGQRLPAGSDGTEFAAHAAFVLADRRIGDLEKLRIGGSGSELQQSITHFNSEVSAAIADYEKVVAFRRATWTLAAYFRMGHVTEIYSKALLAAPCPPEVRRLGDGACGLYRTKLEESVAEIEAQAVSRFAVTIEQAGRLGVANTWTREARSRLSAYRPDKYPQLHDPHVAQGSELGASEPSVPIAANSQARTLAEARAALASKQSESALVLARQVLAEDEHNVAALLVLARGYYQLGKLDLATALIGLAQQSDPNSGEAYLLLGLLTLTRDSGDSIAATAAFKRATELDPSLVLGWHNLAAQYLLAKNQEQGLLAAQRAAALMPSSPPVQLNLGSALRQSGRLAEAAEVYRRLIEREPQFADGYYNLGVLSLDVPSSSAGPDSDALAQKRAAVQYLMRYQDLARGQRDEAAETYIKEARGAVEREERKQKRKSGATP